MASPALLANILGVAKVRHVDTDNAGLHLPEYRLQSAICHLYHPAITQNQSCPVPLISTWLPAVVSTETGHWAAVFA